jgi:hypothetical protein
VASVWTDSYIDTNWGSGFNPASAFSVNFWFLYPDFVIEPGPKYLFGTSSLLLPALGVLFYLEKTDDPAPLAPDLKFVITDEGYSSKEDSISFDGLWSGLMDAHWHMLTIVHHSGVGSDKLHLYIDGVEQTPDDTSFGTFTSVPLNGDIYIFAARENSNDPAEYLGQTIYTAIDDFRFYTRILTETEIDALYHMNGWNP